MSAEVSGEKQKVKLARSKIRAAWAQVIIAFASVLAVLLATFVAWQSQKAVNNNTQTALRQSEDSQLSTAITALGSSNASERVAGLLLLARNAAARFALYSQTGEPPNNVYDDYTTALQVLSGYLSSQGEIFLAAARPAAPPFGRGYGTPTPDHQIDLNYAANQVAFLLSQKMEASVTGLHTGQRPRIDLSNDELWGQSWHHVNFSWIIAYMPGIDLRGANLAGSTWSANTDLASAYLQCADLQGADFRRANLSGADLRGADVQGADFRGANLRGTDLRGADVQRADFRGAHLGFAKRKRLYGIAIWSPRHAISALPAAQWNQSGCLQNSKIWDNMPMVHATTIAVKRTNRSAAGSARRTRKGKVRAA